MSHPEFDKNMVPLVEYIKDKEDFLRFYEKPKMFNHLKERTFWIEQKDDNGNETGKVRIKIISPCFVTEVKRELKYIKD